MKKEHITKFVPEFSWQDARKEFSTYYGENRLLLQQASEALVSLVNLLINRDLKPAPKVIGRVKALSECQKKFELKYLADAEKTGQRYEIKEKITDLVGIRVICIYESDIEKVAKILRENMQVLEETDKSSALQIHENQFGYKGLHLDCQLDGNRAVLPEYRDFSTLRFEVQVRSIVQDAWSEVDHKLKYKRRIPTNLKRRINRLAALFELADQEFEAIRNQTIDLEEKGISEAKNSPKEETLSPFNFLPVASRHFPKFDFEAHKVDGFVDDLLVENEDLTPQLLDDAIAANLGQVQSYVEYLGTMGHKMNPYTQIRHCLYKGNKVLYLNLMRSGPMKNFDRWLEHGTVHPAEIGGGRFHE